MTKRMMQGAGSALAVLIAATMIFPALAQEDGAVDLPEAAAPLPSERPENPAADETSNDGEASEEAAPVPAERPGSKSEGEKGATMRDARDVLSEPAGDEADGKDEPALQPPPAEDAAALRACRAALAGLGAEFRRIDAILPEGAEENGCGIATPFDVSEILPGVALRPKSAMRCQTALALARWVRREVIPAAQALGLGELTALDHGSSYVCRGRNGDADDELSEHAKGNAVDIMGFAFSDGAAIAVSPKEGDGDAAEAFQKAAGSGACLYFTTVLGPGADAYHDDHLHLDIIERTNGYRLCQAP